MGDTQLFEASTGWDIVRRLFSYLDRPAFWLLTIVYELFFNVASADIFANDTLMKFFGRTQLILGVYMMFQLAITILKGIVNPDSFTDSKSGAGNFVMRIAVSLIMLTLLVPFNTGNSNGLEREVSNNGILFGTLYSLQHRLLAGNTLGKLILGTSGDSSYFSEDEHTEEEILQRSARILSSTILKGFYRINLLPRDQWPTTHNYDEKDPAIFNDVRICQSIDDKVIDTYTKVDANPGDIIDFVNLNCRATVNGKTQKYYQFAYNGLISTVVGFMFAIILLSFTIDVAVRAVKLAVLRLIAPIPIISYMDPNGGKDGAFNSWVKTLTSTYIDLFIRLAVVYFVIFLIEDMIVHGVVIKHGSGAIGILSWIIIWVGLFAFAKQSPGFIKKVLGMKDEGGFGLFSGFGDLNTALGLGAVGLGAFGSARANFRSAMAENNELHHGASRLLNPLRNLGSAAAGAIGGGYAGMKAWTGKDGGSFKSVVSAIDQRNAVRASHSTLPGRIHENLYSLRTGRSLADRTSKEAEANKTAFGALKDFKSNVIAESIKHGGEFDFKLQDSQGNVKADFHNITPEMVKSAQEAGVDKDGFYTLAGQKVSSDYLTTRAFDSMYDAGVAAWQRGSTLKYYDGSGNLKHGDSYTAVVTGDGKLSADRARTIKAVNDAGISVGNKTGGALVDSYGDLGKAMGVANRGQQTRETDMKNIMYQANKRQKGS